MKTISTALDSIQKRIKIAYCGWKDFRTKRHIVVFESDDWGSIRMSNKKDWDELLKMGYAVDKRPYERFDTLESAEDLEALFEVLNKHKDSNGNHPVITANMLMTNPDFNKIDQSGFREYAYEPIAKTYERYYGNTKVLEMMKQGMDAGLFMPQSHGREHFNVAQWMKGLQAGDEDLLTAFRYGMCGIAPKAHPEQGNQMMSALWAETEEEQQQIDEIVSEGLSMFKQLWGFKSKSFVAPRYIWNKSVENVLIKGGVELIQTSRVNKPAYKRPSCYFYTGELGNEGVYYSVRNCKFEPATNEGGASLDSLMAQIDNAFGRHRIAIFSTHRINYVGGINLDNRSRTLNLLDNFLTKLLIKYPGVEFVSSDKLISLFKK